MTRGFFSDSEQATAACRDALRDRFIHVAGVGWMEYDGKRWVEVPDTAAVEAVRVWTRDKLVDAVSRDSDLVTAWSRRLDAPKLKNVVSLARGMPGINVAPAALDANPDVLNVHNGVVYLPTGDLLPHSPDLYLTKIAGADYVPTALHADWTAALAAIPPEVEPWLQVRYGQAVTGHACPDDTVVIQQGGGANGKSTVVAGVAAALGDYYYMASSRILMSSHAGHTTDFADLRGTRFVAIEETPEAGRLDVVRLKSVAGTPRITARKLYQDNVSFAASHTLMVNTNYPPMVAETDDGTWRRLLLVRFPYRYVDAPVAADERQGDRRLRERIATGPEQARAVLAWLVEGATRWYAGHAGARTFPPVPAEVLEQTEAWRAGTDHIETFWSDHLDPDPESYIYAGDLVWMFNQFMRQHGNAPLAASTFVRRFEHHAMTDAHIVHRRRVRGGAGQALKQSRPFGALDPFSRLPGCPDGQVWAWVGVRFRAADGRWELGQHAHDLGERPT